MVSEALRRQICPGGCDGEHRHEVLRCRGGVANGGRSVPTYAGSAVTDPPRSAAASVMRSHTHAAARSLIAGVWKIQLTHMENFEIGYQVSQIRPNAFSAAPWHFREQFLLWPLPP
jgi:hypothetical protein